MTEPTMDQAPKHKYEKLWEEVEGWTGFSVLDAPRSKRHAEQLLKKHRKSIEIRAQEAEYHLERLAKEYGLKI